MVNYPDPGPCGGTSGSPVVTCPNHPNSISIILLDTIEGRSEVLRRNIDCKVCGKRFLKKEHLSPDMNRMHIKRS